MTYKLYLPDRIIMASTNGYVVEVDNPTHTPVGSSPYNSISAAGVSDHYYYLAALNRSGDPSLYRVDPVSEITTPLLPVGSYEVYSFSVGKDDYIYFNAMKMANGANVIGEITPYGTVILISDTADNREVTSLVRLY
jgi:hypothetical protein